MDVFASSYSIQRPLCGPIPEIQELLAQYRSRHPGLDHGHGNGGNEYNEEFSPKVSLTDDENKLVFSHLETHLRIAGTAELAGWNTSLPYHRVKPLVEKSAALFPGVFSKMNYRDPDWVMSNLNPWTCLRPATPSNVPYVSRSQKFRNFWLNTGHGTLGWTMGMATAEMITTEIMNA